MQSIKSNSSMENSKQSSIQQETNSQLPDSWKQVAHSLIKNRRNTAEKMKLGKMRQFYRLKIMALIDQLKVKSNAILDISILNIDQIQNLIQQKQSLIDNLIAKNQKLKKNIISIAQTIIENKEKIVIKTKSLKQMIISNNRNRVLHNYVQFSFEQIDQIRQQVNRINEQVNIKTAALKLMETQIQTLKQNYQLINIEIQHKRQINLLLSAQLAQLKQNYIFSTREELSDCKQMIECLFHVGILIQQNYVFEKVQKCLLLQEKAKVIKIQKNLLDRKITINSQRDTLGFMVITTIYMHCKSLFISNIVNTMQRLSYYSEQFNNIYDFQLFQRYCKIFIEKEKLNDQWKIIRSKVYASNPANEIIKILYVIIDQKIKNQVLQYMQIYENSQNFQIKISNTLKMMIRILSPDEFLEQKTKNVNDQKYILHIRFKEKLPSKESQQLNDILQV